jgi:hypothetical protein
LNCAFAISVVCLPCNYGESEPSLVSRLFKEMQTFCSYYDSPKSTPFQI